MSANPETNGGDISSADAHFIIECLKNLNGSKQVDIGKVATVFKYSNVLSARNRLRNLSKRYGFPNLECRFPSTPTKAGKAGAIVEAAKDDTAGDDPSSSGETVQSTPSKPARKPAGRKGAKVNSKPIPATGPVSADGSTSPSKKRGPRGKGKLAVAQEAAVMESVEIPVKKDNGNVKMEDGGAIKVEA
ncbi:hypothetical protein KXW98_003909 [Aspergillus fumigatus]|uniref:Uncharacterized protein n=2 Tax=Aspergillus fumigatus TaxID=746128 RepID=A4D9R8_ASPFU|nr:conserved hypothetical protein [Aspergillus fumigatus Af293]KAF4266833.1 hypothetical protein CNMCM8812_002533 [Aspergillus fumigatus]KMK57500.1 hypothetical protein Y699_07041 [Aspergillus fumigatus Z5]EBA27327.1 conserved hypothetical protein [Aspergillus fumigatus Af293]KAF4267867.1 hypothetical protein CNMCM8714_002632 [Aspergillus fumigatus]KAH1272298.1 hypothetical protein KXX45_009468 [Aspergillus fumigatus]